MDEPFHVNQTQKYCAGQLHEWDPKITTFPGLYVFAALPSWIGAAVGLSGAPAWCTLAYLRGLNLLPALATPYLLLLLIRRLHPNTSPSDALANAVLLSLAPTHFFYHFLYYTDSLATVSALALLAIVMPARAERPSPRARPRLARRRRARRRRRAPRSAPGAGAGACRSARRTPWIAFALGCDLLELDHSKRAARLAAARPPRSPRCPPRSPSAATRRCARRCAAGGRSPCCSLPSCLRRRQRRRRRRRPRQPRTGAAPGAAALLDGVRSRAFDPHALTVGLRGTLRGAAAAAAAAPATAAAALAAALGAAHYAYCHPFLLADNRHLRLRVAARPRPALGVRYALAPAYAFLGAPLPADRPPVWSAAHARARRLRRARARPIAAAQAPVRTICPPPSPPAPPLAGAALWGSRSPPSHSSTPPSSPSSSGDRTRADGSVARFML